MKLSEFKPAEEVLERVRKCTAAEEVEKLAQEYDVELTAEEISEVLKSNSLTELNDEQLDQVAGGDSKKDLTQHLPPNHGPQISMYAEGHVGEKVYCVNDDDSNQFCWGILERSYEKERNFWKTNRVHEILIEGWNHDTDVLYVHREGYQADRAPSGQILKDISGNNNTLYLFNKQGIMR